MRFVLTYLYCLLKVILLFCIAFAFIFIFRDKILSSFAEYFELEVSPITNDYSIIMLGGNPSLRLPAAINLYEINKSNNINTPLIITSPKKYYSQDFSNIFKPELDLVMQALDSKNIPYQAAPSLKNGATSTTDEALDLARFVKDNNINSILILTDKFHTLRAYKTFQKVFKEKGINCKIFITGVQNPIFDTHNWYKSELGLRTYIVELGTWIMHALIDRSALVQH